MRKKIRFFPQHSGEICGISLQKNWMNSWILPVEKSILL